MSNTINPCTISCSGRAPHRPWFTRNAARRRRPVRGPAATLAACLWLVPTLMANDWPHLSANAAHTGTALRAARDLNTIRWTVAPLADEDYVWHSSPVVHGGRVFVNARYYVDDAQVGNRLIAYAISDGQRLWATPIEIGEYDSWSSPAIDARNQTVLIGSGYHVYALDVASGEIEWQRELARSIVNPSPVVTDNLLVNGTPANRVFITDYSGYETSGELHAINVDAYDAQDNPYDPGETVWSAPLPGTSGNSPAYEDGAIFVSSVDGLVQALDAHDGSIIWENDVDLSGYPEYSGFYSGIAVRNGYAYAASCVFYGTGNNSGLFKFDAESGEIVWVAPCERTDSIPVVTADGRIYLSAGLEGYGSVVKVQAFQDHGESFTELWDTHVDTEGTLIVGGWTHQPAHARGYVYAGTPSNQGGSFYDAYTDLYILDTAATPADPGFIVAHHTGAGGSPAIADGTVYSFGQDGLFAFDPSPACLADLDGDGAVTLSDLAALLGAYGSTYGDVNFDSDSDLNRDGVVDLSDLAELLGAYGTECL